MASTKTKGTATSTRGAGEEELDDTMLCDNDPCTCEDADVVRGSQRFCSERCADAVAGAGEESEGTESTDSESCLCGHAECEASVSAGAGGQEERRQPPRTPPGRI